MHTCASFLMHCVHAHRTFAVASLKHNSGRTLKAKGQICSRADGRTANDDLVSFRCIIMIGPTPTGKATGYRLQPTEYRIQGPIQASSPTTFSPRLFRVDKGVAKTYQQSVLSLGSVSNEDGLHVHELETLKVVFNDS